MPLPTHPPSLPLYLAVFSAGSPCVWRVSLSTSSVTRNALYVISPPNCPKNHSHIVWLATSRKSHIYIYLQRERGGDPKFILASAFSSSRSLELPSTYPQMKIMPTLCCGRRHKRRDDDSDNRSAFTALAAKPYIFCNGGLTLTARFWVNNNGTERTCSWDYSLPKQTYIMTGMNTLAHIGSFP
jgi:hypothetical protein